MARHVSLDGTATPSSGFILQTFVIKQKVVFISNDSDTYDLEVNFDQTTDQNGTFTLKAGEAVSDMPITCSTLSVNGVGGSVPFRALGV